jgi:RNA polymerase sigma-54 factor
MRPGLRLRQTTRLALTPDLRTALTLLRLPAVELAEMIDREAEENPFLVVHRPAASARSDFDVALDTVATRPSLMETLRAQIVLMHLPEAERQAALYLAGELRDDGYLDGTLAEIAAQLEVPEALLESGLRAVQACEPTGVGARDLKECIALQLIDRGLDRDRAAAMVARLDDFAAGRWRVLAHALGCTEAEVKRLAGLLRAVSPRPVTEAPAPESAPLMPDLVFEQTAEGTFAVRLGREAAPELRIDTALLARAGADSFVTDRRARAEALIRALAFRGQTLLRIGDWIARNQHRYLAEGPEHLRPATRAAVAADLGLHPSTVGRAVAGKGFALGSRLTALDRVFSGGLAQADGGTVAALSVQHRIAQMVAAEDPAAPLSDAEISNRLEREGVDIARRTVAKYRGCLRIPSSAERRRRTARSRCAAGESGPTGRSVR